MKKKEHRTELGALKASLEWSVCIPRRVWIVEGYNIIRRRANYQDRYMIDRIGSDDGTLAECLTLTDAFRWVAEAD